MSLRNHGLCKLPPCNYESIYFEVWTHFQNAAFHFLFIFYLRFFSIFFYFSLLSKLTMKLLFNNHITTQKEHIWVISNVLGCLIINGTFPSLFCCMPFQQFIPFPSPPNCSNICLFPIVDIKCHHQLDQTYSVFKHNW